ncbi:hypothetical protein ACWDTR_33575 [Streptomyces sp. NPDC003470]
MRFISRGLCVGSVASAAAVTLLAAAPASAYSQASVVSYSSTKGGWGTANAMLSSDAFWLRVCDRGTADGYRAVGRLTKGSFYVQRQAAGGSGSCVGGAQDGVTGGWLDAPITGTYTLTVCLRDGAGGMDFNCDSTTFYHDGST